MSSITLSVLRKYVHWVSIVVIIAATTGFTQKDYGVHDPSGMVRENDRYYTFYTSKGIEYAYSTDLCTWHLGGKIFSAAFPSWITAQVSGFDGNFWAPQVFFMNGLWHVYYSCSTFGSRVSAIGLATSPSLKNPDWQDRGMVVSTNNSSDHNAIDPAVLMYDGRVWLVFGSFWKGIVMTELDSLTGKPIKNSTLSYLANNDPEAAFLIHHDTWYYLFFNRGKCCNGVNSTYYICVGRAEEVTGPYLDKNGKKTGAGGGTVLLESQGRFIGPGHFGYLADSGREYMSYHFYDRDKNGASKLRISTISWKDGWPVIETGFDACNPVATGTLYVNIGRSATIPETDFQCNGVKINGTVRIYSLSGRLLAAVGPVENKTGGDLRQQIRSVAAGNSVVVLTNGTGTGTSLVKVW